MIFSLLEWVMVKQTESKLCFIYINVAQLTQRVFIPVLSGITNVLCHSVSVGLYKLFTFWSSLKKKSICQLQQKLGWNIHWMVLLQRLYFFPYLKSRWPPLQKQKILMYQDGVFCVPFVFIWFSDFVPLYIPLRNLHVWCRMPT